jgi:hypothetical protein
MMDVNMMANSVISGLKNLLDEARTMSMIYGMRKETLSFFDSRIVAYVLRVFGENHQCSKMIRAKLEACGDNIGERVLCLDEFISQVEDAGLRAFSYPKRAVFIGHGTSHEWKDLRDFLQEKLPNQTQYLN